MSAIKDIGAVKDSDGSEVRIGWAADNCKSLSVTWVIYLRFTDSWWIKQEGVIVQNSQEAHEWANEKVNNGGLRARRNGITI